MGRIRDEIAFIIRRRVLLMTFYRLGSIVAGSRPFVSILCYHSLAGGNRYGVGSHEFTSQLKSLKKEVDFISLDEATSILEGKKLLRPAVVVTIDDGYRDVLDILPFVSENKIPIALFALSDPEKANRRELEHKGELLSFAELKMLSERGFTIGCHSKTHADFSKLSSLELNEEIAGAKKRLEEEIGSEIKYFAYPKGIYTSEAIERVKLAGFKAAFSVLPGCIEEGINKWILPRTVVNKYDSIASNPMLYVKGPFLIGRLLKIFRK